MSFYSGEKILSMLDVNRNKPEIYMVTDLRSTGKTTYFVKMLTNRARNKKEKYVYLTRYDYELDALASALYKDIGTLFFPNIIFDSKVRGKGLYASITANGQEIGYGLSLNSFDKIKKKSHLFVDASSILFDEFQSESNRYIPNEITAIQSIHKSLSRGGGKMVRYLPLYMLSNHITLLNPYFNHFGLTNLHRKTRYYHGNGFVLEQLFNESALVEASKSGFESAFSNTDYSNMNKQGRYLLDDNNYVDKNHKINGRYVLTFIFENKEYGLYNEDNQFFCGSQADTSYPIRYVIGKGTGSNVELLSRSPSTLNILRNAFINGNILFGDLNAKQCIMSALSY